MGRVPFLCVVTTEAYHIAAHILVYAHTAGGIIINLGVCCNAIDKCVCVCSLFSAHCQVCKKINRIENINNAKNHRLESDLFT